MKRAYFISLFLCLTLLGLTTSLFSQSNPVSLINRTAAVASPRVASPTSASQADPQAQARILEGYGKLPLSFEANHGQADARVKFLSRTGGYTLFLTRDEAVLAWSGKKTKKTTSQRLKPASLAGPSGTAEPSAAEPPAAEPRAAEPSAAEPAARDLRFVSGYRFSDTASPGKPDAPSGAGQRPSTPSADAEVVATGGVLRMKLRNANPAAKVTGEDELAGTSNYFIGNDPAKWRTKVPTYAKVKYEGIYPGIDLVYYGNQRQLEYDFIVAPGADPHRIAFDVRGAKRIRRDARGDLVLAMKMGEDEIRWHKPVAYQEKNGTRQEVAARYAISDANWVGFELAKYDVSRPLYIDPLIYSTYLGGSGQDDGYSIAVNSAGNAYVTGVTSSIDFPTVNPLQGAKWLGDAFVTKINPEGSALVYSTYLGGNGGDYGIGIAVDSAGNAYVTGDTYSPDFPTTPGAFQTALAGGRDAFVTKINPTGSALVYSTYLGGGIVGGSEGDDVGTGIAVDSSGNAYVTGYTLSADFPTTPGAFQTACGTGWCSDAFVTEINPEGSALVYSTYLGGSGGDSGMGIAVDSTGNAYVTGNTYSTDFPTTPGAFQTALAGGYYDAFVTKVNPTGSALVYSTYLGGNGDDSGNSIAVDSASNAYVTGYTDSTNFPTKNPLQATYGGNGDAFVAKINAAGSALVYSTYLGGSGQDDYDHANQYQVGAIAVDSGGNAYVTGYTGSTNFPTTPGALKTTCGGCANYGDAFVAKVNPTGSTLAYSTYLGGRGIDAGVGIAVDSSRNAYVTGYTSSTNFPTKNPIQPANAGFGYDAFVAKVDVRAIPTITLSSSLNPSIYGQAVTFAAVVTSTIGAPPNGETITFMKGATVLGAGTLSGGSASFTISTLPAGTNYIRAVYGGDANFAPSTSNKVPQVVNKATTTTTLTSSLNPSNFGQSVTFTATVTPQFSGTVKWSVTFYDGTTALKTTSLSGGAAKFTTSTLSSSTHSITATYNGSPNFDGSTSAPVNQVVRVTTTTTLSSSPNPSTYGQAVTFTATVTSSLGAPPPDGETVSFMKGTTVLGTGPLSGGSASFKTSTLPAGTDAIKAVYGGDSNLPGSTSKAVSQVVSKATTTTTLTSSLNPSSFGQSVTFTASVTPQFSGTVQGTVTFYDGTTLLKTVSLSGGVAKYATSTLTVGAHSITATYNGGPNFDGSSASLTQKVN
jgi:Bacterial Ig-like domain (group 3)/Beta-propeller repeat